VPEPKVSSKICIVLSLIRHGQCVSNTSGSVNSVDDPLTSYGRLQAEQLGREWKNVHIDALYSSTLERARDTALQISTQSQVHIEPRLEVNQDPFFVERKAGDAVNELARCGRMEAAGDLYMGVRTGVTPRDYRPPRGGESPDDVASRAKAAVKMLLMVHGEDLEEPPKAFVDKVTINSPETLPEGIPHVVVVSHNIFLSELYEKLLSWDTPHRMTTCNYSNINWSRHILWYDRTTRHLEFSDMRVPCDIDWYTPRSAYY